ncbi:hypothetical protein F5Y10DRAFT_29753 [Nemania abortiva]|nr:hypothetical protein F5Y10DRAFT_29753 [Nemania abortiva]
MPVLEALWRRQAGALLQRTRVRAPRHPPTLSGHVPAARLRTRRSQPTNTSEPSSPPPSTPQANRVSRILTSTSRFLPKRLQTALQNLRSAPLSHIVAFLVLHEITAVVPLFGLTTAFHLLEWTPVNLAVGQWAEDVRGKYIPYFVKKQWFGLENAKKADSVESEDEDGQWVTVTEWKEGLRTGPPREEDSEATSAAPAQGLPDEWKIRRIKQAATVEDNDPVVRLGVQVAAAYAITKLLLVPRIALSLWLTPWLARGLVGFRRALRRKGN